MKWYVLIIIGLLTVGLANALPETLYDLCEDSRDIHRNCSMLTPDITCTSYDYDIISLNGTIEETGSLKQLNGTIYYFNLTVAEGDYIIRLCDNTTREVRVLEPDDKMIPAAIIMLPLLLGIMLIIVAGHLGEDHDVLKWFLFLFSFITFFMSLWLGMEAVVHFYDWPALESNLGLITWLVGIIFSIILVYLFIYMIWKGTKRIATQKEEKMKY